MAFGCNAGFCTKTMVRFSSLTGPLNPKSLGGEKCSVMSVFGDYGNGIHQLTRAYAHRLCQGSKGDMHAAQAPSRNCFFFCQIVLSCNWRKQTESDQVYVAIRLFSAYIPCSIWHSSALGGVWSRLQTVFLCPQQAFFHLRCCHYLLWKQ